MKTSIYISKKLEKSFSKKINISEEHPTNYFGKWNAQIFFIDRQKWFLITHSETKFSIVLPNINANNISKIKDLFMESLYQQFIYESVDITREKLNVLIGELVFHKTDNDKKTIGTQNSILELIKNWKYQKNDILCSTKELSKRLNMSPTNSFKWKSPREMMLEKIKTTGNNGYS